MSTHNPPRRAERGTAYVIALLVLVVLSILGLSLALISQTEQQLGANELTTHRAMYGAEAGMQLAMARVLTVNSSVDNASVTSVTPMTFLLDEDRFDLVYDTNLRPTVVPDPPGILETHFAEHVVVSPFIPIRDTFCDLCPAAEGDVQLLNANHAVVSTSQRIAWNGANSEDLTDGDIDAAPKSARKQLYLMVGLQPWWPPRWEAIADDLQTSKVVQETLGGTVDDGSGS
jgi:hypothetical protein